MKQAFKVWGTDINGNREMQTPQTWREVEEIVSSMQEEGYSDIAIKTLVDNTDPDKYVPEYFEFVGFIAKDLAVYQWRVD